MSAYKDAQAQNDISRNVKQYSDLDLFFGQRNVGKDVNKITDIQAVKRSLRNLINLNAFEKPFNKTVNDLAPFKEAKEAYSVSYVSSAYISSEITQICRALANVAMESITDLGITAPVGLFGEQSIIALVRDVHAASIASTVGIN